MDTIGRRLRAEREAKSLSQQELGAIGGVQKKAQFNYEKGERRPTSDYLQRIAAAGIDIIYVLTGKRALDMLTPGQVEEAVGATMADIDEDRFTLIPRYDAQGAAGSGILNTDGPPADHLAFPRDWLARQGLRAQSAFLMTVAGTSMEPTLHDGDLIMVDRARCAPRQRRIYVFTDPGTAGTRIKRIELAQGGLTIRSDNPAPDDPLLELHTADTADLVLHSILGEVVWVGHKLDRKGS